ncbi:MAG: hypothetical protein FJZ00_05330 [Candidatus Sericytochromatia bacterium]|uniref:Uncharacterized protein n=1 Tax=Candidatus Tanganyikabacteria bacterium TaxID=2961651 RepID=A0A938BMZ9_9BACT|nr:hypothetical protein [Candidatus Tanganyikabacteria bacterium]
MADPSQYLHEAFARHRDDQLRRWLALTPRERLQWLEGAQRFANKVGARSATRANEKLPDIRSLPPSEPGQAGTDP